MEQSIKKLQKEFNKIRKMEYIKSIRQGPTGIGATFESLLGKNEESFEIPDYYGIEIKTRRAYSKSYITLFNAVPTGSTFHETKRLRDYYGYPSRKDKNLKELNTEIFATKKTKVGLWYYFQLKIDTENKKIILLIYNHQQILIDSNTYWDFGILEKKLKRKLQILALIKAWPNRKNGIEYFKYYKMNIFILKDFDSFIKALINGKIKITLKIESSIEQNKYGQIKEHGVGFSIKEEELTDLFELYR